MHHLTRSSVLFVECRGSGGHVHDGVCTCLVKAPLFVVSSTFLHYFRLATVPGRPHDVYDFSVCVLYHFFLQYGTSYVRCFGRRCP